LQSHLQADLQMHANAITHELATNPNLQGLALRRAMLLTRSRLLRIAFVWGMTRTAWRSGWRGGCWGGYDVGFEGVIMPFVPTESQAKYWAEFQNLQSQPNHAIMKT